MVGNGRHPSPCQSKYQSTVQSMSPVQSPESRFCTNPSASPDPGFKGDVYAGIVPEEQLLAISKRELIKDVCKIEGTMIDSFRGTNIAFCSGPF